MYEQVFGFNDRPFTSTPFVKHYFAARAIDQSYGQARSCIERASGPVIVVGNPGTGKTLLLNLIAEAFRDQFSVVNLTCARLDQRSDLLQSILFELDQPYRDMSEGELRLALIDFLKPGDRCPNGILLLVDEAHSLSHDLLDEIRLITNFVRDGVPRVRLVLVGNQRLEENLTNPKLESFNQRVAARTYLENLSYDETRSYILTHLTRAGGQSDSLFGDEAFRSIYELSDGCPRLINQVCEHSLILAATCGSLQISEERVREAWNDLQNIPGNGQSNNDRATSGNGQSDEEWTVLEFGSLDEENKNDSLPITADADDANSDFMQEGPEQHPESVAVDSFESERMDEIPFQLAHVDSPPVGWEQDIHEGDVREFLIDHVREPEEDDVHQHDDEQIGTSASQGPVREMENAAEHDGLISDDIEVTGIQPGVGSADESWPNESWANQPLSDEPLPDGRTPGELALDESEDGSVDGCIETEKQVPSVENPFDETYEEEEFLIDKYIPIVAQQNRDSLDVTASQLQALRPPQMSISLAELQADLLGESPEGRSKDSDESSTPDNSIANGVDKYVDQKDGLDDSLIDIQRRAEEIIESLDLNQDSMSAGIDEERPSEDPAAVEHFSQHPELVPYNQIQLSPELPDDDRDMIVVSRVEQIPGSSNEHDGSEVQTPYKPSTGRASRMDYGQLFEQLRQLPSDE